MKRFSNKYGKNSKNNKFNKYGKKSKNNKFHKILHLEREKVKSASRCPQISKKWQEFFFLCEKIEQQIWQK